MGKTIIIIPAKNEAVTIKQVIHAIQARVNYTILVVNDASTDHTAHLARQAGAKVVSLCFSLGAWGAMQTGLRYAYKNGYAFAITLDADGQHDPVSLLSLLEPVQQQQADVVIGACPQRGNVLHRTAWSLFRRMSGVKLEDLTSGYRVYNQAAIALLASEAATLLEYQDLGVLMLVRSAGLHIQEVPAVMHPRQSGRSRVFRSWWTISRYMLHTAVLCIAQGQPQGISAKQKDS